MNFDKFKLLFWKNARQIAVRHPLLTVIVILVPIILVVMLVCVRFQEPKRHPEQFYKSYCPFRSDEWCSFVEDGRSNETFVSDTPEPMWSAKNFSKMSIAYAPSGNEMIDKAMMKEMKAWFADVIPFATPADLETYFIQKEDLTTFGGVVFSPPGIEQMPDIPEKISVHIRFRSELNDPEGKHQSKFHWDTNSYYHHRQYQGPRTVGLPIGEYTEQGFVALQMMVTKCLINVLLPEPLPPKVSPMFPELRLQMFPCPGWIEQVTQSHTMVTATTVNGFLLTFLWMVNCFVKEKEKHMGTTLWVMGIPTWVRMTSWFFTWYCLLLIVVIPVTAILAVPWYPVRDVQNGVSITKYVTILMASSPFVVFLFFSLYIAALIVSAMVLYSLFDHTARAMTFAVVCFVLTFIPYMIVADSTENRDIIHDGKMLLSCLFSNTALGFGLRTMLQWEDNGRGAQFWNMWEPTSSDREVTMGMVLCMLALDFVFYILLAYYVDAVYPSEQSEKAALPWNFFLKKKYWCRCGKTEELKYHRLTYVADEYVEPDPPGYSVGCRFIHVWKIYDNNIVAVKDLSISFYRGQVTTLVAQRAGGTRPVSALLSGETMPTAGTIVVEDWDVHEDALTIRHNLGYCPRHNTLFDFLTTEEHFYFVSKVKGVPTRELNDETDLYIQTLKMHKDRKAKASRLSGDAKRKLSVALAFTGRSKLVVLDAPMKGLDISARKDLWDFIRRMKEGRTVIVSTLFIDEAEKFSDRIAILADGELQCYGSVKFLKKTFGAGCYLSIYVEELHDLTAINRLLFWYMPDTDEPENITDKDGGDTIFRYMLPLERTSHIGRMLADFDLNKRSLGIKHYRINLTTMEDILLRVCSQHHRRSGHIRRLTLDRTAKHRPTFAQRYNRPVTIKTGRGLLFNHFVAMSLKRVIMFSRQIGTFCLVMTVMVVLLWFSMAGKTVTEPLLVLQEMPMNFDKFPTSQIMIELPDNATRNDIGLDVYEEYEGSYHSIATTYHYEYKLLPPEDNLADRAFKERRENVQLFNQLYVIGMSFHSPKINQAPILKMWYSDYPVHGEGVASSFGLHTIYHMNTAKYIKFVNAPLPFQYEVESRHDLTLQSLYVTLVFMLVMCIAAGYPVFFYVMENVTKSHLLQFLFGVKIWVFLTVNFIFDFVVYLFMILVMILLMLTFERDNFRDTDDTCIIAPLLMMYGFAMIPLTYVASKMYNTAGCGFIRHICVSYIIGVALIGCGLLFRLMNLPTLERTQRILLIIPFYALGDAFQRYQQLSRQNDTCGAVLESCKTKRTADECNERYCKQEKYLGFSCCESELNMFAFEPGRLSENMIYLGVFGVLMIIVAALIDYKFFRSLSWHLGKVLQKTRPRSEPEEDADVARERVKISGYPEFGKKKYHLVLQDLTKNYGNNMALNGVSVGIKKGECFGLLGHAGSGKSTIFKLLTGEIRLAYGSIYIAGKKLGNRRNLKANSLIGYCPQTQGLFDTLTARQIMMMYCLIRGIALPDCRLLTEMIAVDFDLFHQLTLEVQHLSEGNRRKLNCAMALIGEPMILFLDEPTLGMDARSRMKTWNLLSEYKRKKGATILLTTHSMAESERLCSRMGIMVQGNFNCMGSLPKLKDKFSHGYTVIIRLKPVNEQHEGLARMEAIEKYFHGTFEKTLLIEKSPLRLTLFTENQELSCTELFIEMEKVKERFHIKDYTIGQTSLEQVFLYIARRHT